MLDILSILGQFFTRALDPILIGIRQSDIGAGLAFLVLLGGLLVLSFATWRFMRDRKLINQAKSVLEGVTSEADFAEKFQTINHDMERVRIIGPAWSEFCETLVQPKRGRDGALVPAANTVRPHVYFNTHELPIGPKFLTVWPNIFVGIGLTITFLGLISALTQASASMADVAGDPQKVQNVVQNLLNVASAKFYASLVALFVSVILTLTLRGISARTANLLASLNHRIESGVRFLSQESLTLRANELIEEQLEQLKTFNTDLAIKVGEKVTEAIIPVLSDIRETSERSRQDLEQGFSGLGDRVTDAMSGATQDAMQKVAESLQAVSEKLDSLGDVLTNSLAGFDEQLKASLSSLSSALEQTMSGVSQNLNESLASIGPQINQSLSSITHIMDGLQQKIESYASEGASKVGESIQVATGAAGDVISQAGTEFSNAFGSATAGLIGNLQNLASNLNSLDENLKDLPAKLDGVGSSLSTAATSITTASDQFSSSATGMRSVIEPLAQFASQNRAALELLNEGLQSSSAAVERSANDIQASVTTLNQSVSERLQQLSKGDQALETYMTGLNASTERVIENILKFVNDIDKGFSQSIGHLQGSIDDLLGVADQLAQASRGIDSN